MSTRQREWLKYFNCFFITTTFKNWLKLFINEEYYSVVIESIRFCLIKYNVHIIYCVLMPTHLHLILFYDDKIDVSGFMRDMKKYTSVIIRDMIKKERREEELRAISYHKSGQMYKVWMDRFDCVFIKSKKVLLTKIKYIHENPLRKGLVNKEEEWKYSSAGYYKTEVEGVLPITHAGQII